MEYFFLANDHTLWKQEERDRGYNSRKEEKEAGIDDAETEREGAEEDGYYGGAAESWDVGGSGPETGGTQARTEAGAGGGPRELLIHALGTLSISLLWEVENLTLGNSR